MFALSNTYITNSKRKRVSYITLFILILLGSNTATAQDAFTISPLKKTTLPRFQHDLYAYASGGSNEAALDLVIINNQYNIALNSMSTHANIGFNAYLNFKNYLGANLGLGYTHERFAKDYGLFGNNGAYASWLNTEVCLSFLCISAGMCFDFFLGSRVVNKDSFSYEGINEQCFNKFSCHSYLSLFATFRRFKIEVRYCNYMRPHINPDKITYYNVLTSYIDPDYFEFRIYYRIFTSGNRIKTPERFLIIKGQSL